MTRSQWRWWCALRPVFLYHCMWPPVWSPFQWQGGGLSYLRPYDQTRHVTPVHHQTLAVELASLVLIREVYCQQENWIVSETEATSGKIMGGEARSLQVQVESCRSRTRQGQFLLAQSVDSTKLCSVLAGNELLSFRNRGDMPWDHTCLQIHKCIVFSFFSQIQDGTVQSEWSYPPGRAILFLPVECIFMSLNFSISLDTLYHKRFGKAPRSPVFLKWSVPLL